MKTSDIITLMEPWLNDNSIPYEKSEHALGIKMPNTHWVIVASGKVIANVALPDGIPPEIVRTKSIRQAVEEYSEIVTLNPTDPEFFNKIMTLVR